MLNHTKNQLLFFFFLLAIFLPAKILHIVVNQNKERRYKIQKYIKLEGFVKSNNEAVEAVVQRLAEKYKIEKETVNNSRLKSRACESKQPALEMGY